MKRFLLKQGLCIAIFALSLLVPSHLIAQNRIHFSKEKITEISSILNYAGEGEVSIEAGQKSDTLKITVEGKAKVHSNKYFCLFCLSTVRIAKNLRIPTAIFMEKTFDDLKGIKILEPGVFRTHYQLETVEMDGKKYTKIKEPRVRDQIESDIILEVPVKAHVSEFIVSGPQGAHLKKQGKGFLLVQGEAYLLESTEKPTKAPAESTLSIKLSTAGLPDGARRKMELKVLTGKYKLKSGTELWTGSKVFVSEDSLTFPLGLTIHVGEGGVTLRGQTYPEGAKLTVGKGGSFHSTMTPVLGHSGKPAREGLKEQKKTVRITVEQIYTSKHDSIEKLEEKLLPFESLSKKLLSHCGDLIIVGPEANKYDYALKIRARGEALGASYSPMGVGKDTYRYTGASVSGSTALEGIGVSTYEIPFYGRIRPLSQINMPDSRTSLYYAPFEDALRQSSFISDLIDLLAEEFGTPFLLDCLKDEDSAIRKEAGLALSGMGTSAVKPLIEALKTRHPKIRKNAAKILGNTRDSQALEPLITALSDEDVGVRKSATIALGKIKNQRAIGPLMTALMDEDRIVRINAGLALEKIGASAVEPLIKALKSENANVRDGAAKTLERITCQSFGKNYEAWSRWRHEKKKRDTN